MIAERLGVSVPAMREIARELGKDYELALELWRSGIPEAMITASMIDEPRKLTEKQMEDEVKDINSWDICDQVCKNLFEKTPLVWKKILDRNSVRKAVNWALRNIGTRNVSLNEAAVEAAKGIQLSDSKAARRIASDALRELKSEAVKRRSRK